MELAIRAVLDEGMSLRAAAKKYDVPKNTLHHRIEKRNVMQKRGASRKTLSDADEAFLSDYLLKCAVLGVTLNTSSLSKLIQKIAARKGLPVIGKKQFSSFMESHPEVTDRITQCVNRSKSMDWTLENCPSWTPTMEELYNNGWLSDPQGLFYLDEAVTAVSDRVDFVRVAKFNVRPKRDAVPDASGKYVRPPRNLVTVVSGGNAAGMALRPLIAYNDGVSDTTVVKELGDHCYWVGVNNNGIVDGDVSAAYVRKELLPSMTAGKNVIFVNGHGSHIISEDVIIDCVDSEKEIRIVTVPTDRTQKKPPLNMKMFGPPKQFWREFLREQIPVIKQGIDKPSFAWQMRLKWTQNDVDGKVRSDFATAGIFPFDPAVVSTTAFPLSPTMQKQLPTTPAPPPPSQLFVKEFNDVRNALRSIQRLEESDVMNIMNFAKRTLEGFGPSAPGTSAAPRKRQKKKVLSKKAKNVKKR